MESGIANQPRKTYCTCKFSRDFAFTFYSLFSHLCMLFVFTNFWSVVFISVSCYISWELGSIYWLKKFIELCLCYSWNVSFQCMLYFTVKLVKRDKKGDKISEKLILFFVIKAFGRSLTRLVGQSLILVSYEVILIHQMFSFFWRFFPQMTV